MTRWNCPKLLAQARLEMGAASITCRAPRAPQFLISLQQRSKLHKINEMSTEPFAEWALKVGSLMFLVFFFPVFMPGPECSSVLAERDLRKLLPAETIDRLLARSLEQAVSCAADIRACPTP